ncbi:hypothetical protein PVAND_017347 [Polypedilum vanderplanki]|uniref:Uncharacterized protein n=1 Tax=Polypedilum vanderplanki TaxID=319348 RepID=A0A9J6BI03_POLVA|nr:hypothetical protein PVAND_017347 [Polypedilum vanderplanki]
MKLIRSAVFAIIFLINLTYSRELPPTLNEVKTEMMNDFKEIGAIPQYQTFKLMSETNETCVDEKLKLSQNGNKRISELLVKKACVAATILCHGEPNELLDSSFKMTIKRLKQVVDIDISTDCLKSKLQEYDPHSDLLKGFNINQRKVAECNRNSKVQQLIEITRRKSSETCGIEFDEGVKENFKMAIIVKNLEENSEAFNTEMVKHRGGLLKIHEKTLECALGHYE